MSRSAILSKLALTDFICHANCLASRVAIFHLFRCTNLWKMRNRDSTDAHVAQPLVRLSFVLIYSTLTVAVILANCQNISQCLSQIFLILFVSHIVYRYANNMTGTHRYAVFQKWNRLVWGIDPSFVCVWFKATESHILPTSGFTIHTYLS